MIGDLAMGHRTWEFFLWWISFVSSFRSFLVSILLPAAPWLLTCMDCISGSGAFWFPGWSGGGQWAALAGNQREGGVWDNGIYFHSTLPYTGFVLQQRVTILFKTILPKFFFGFLKLHLFLLPRVAMPLLLPWVTELSYIFTSINPLQVILSKVCHLFLVGILFVAQFKPKLG